MISKKIILCSQSPRRRHLLAGLDVDFETDALDMDESFPNHLVKGEVAYWLAEKKSTTYTKPLGDKILLTCDTIVCLGNEVINKPQDLAEATAMIEKLSGRMHEVYTGVCLRTQTKQTTFTVCTKVYFKPLTEQEISYYVNTYKPMDKAGAYGIQEWLGYIGIDKIEGCYYNVMGLPLSKIYEVLLSF